MAETGEGMARVGRTNRNSNTVPDPPGSAAPPLWAQQAVRYGDVVSEPAQSKHHLAAFLDGEAT